MKTNARGNPTGENSRRTRDVAIGGSVWIILVLVVVSIGGWVLGAKSLSQTGLGSVEVESAGLDFGEVWLRPDFQHSLSIRNDSRVSIAISEFRLACSCVKVEPPALRLSPGESRELHLTLDLSPKPGETVDLAGLPFETTISPIIDGKSFPSVWTLRGRSRIPFVMNPTTVDFGETLIADRPFPAKVLRIECHPQVSRLEFEADGASALVTLEKSSAAGEPLAYQLGVSPLPDLSEGEHSFVIKLVAHPREGGALAPITIVVQARVLPDIRVNPDPVVLGRVPEGTARHESLVFSSRSGLPFFLPESIDFGDEGPEVQILSSHDGAESAHSVNLSITPRLLGTHIVKTRVPMMYADGRPGEIPVRISFATMSHSDLSNDADSKK